MTVEEHRTYWSKVAKENGWYKEPFYLQIWMEDNEIIDSVSFKGLERDIFIDNITDKELNKNEMERIGL
tara:strand:+ start:215 stop:421 length:207 start_codon:yes stop_codon:yes gene_type:complete